MAGEQPYRFRHAIDVRFKDIDVGGHAHHSHGLVYFEEARAAYRREVVGRSGVDDIDYIVAEARVRWHQRVHWPVRLDVSLRVPLLARKHFVMDYRVSAPDGTLLVSDRTVQIMYDYRAGASKGVPEDVRAAIAARDGPSDRADGGWGRGHPLPRGSGSPELPNRPGARPAARPWGARGGRGPV